MKEAFSVYRYTLDTLDELPHCLSYEQLQEKGLFKEHYWKSAILMAAATSLPLLYKKVDHQSIIQVVCAKTSIGVSAKLLDNLNDEVHSYPEALHSLSEYESALQKGTYTVMESPSAKAEQSAHEIATWAYRIGSRGCTDTFCKDVSLLVGGQIATLQHKKDKYPSMKEYLSKVSECSIGNTWIDVDLELLENGSYLLKKGNNYIFKSYLIYDDVQDIARDVRTNSVNAAVILGLERGILSESALEQRDMAIIETLKRAGILQELLYLGDLIFLKGMGIILGCNDNPVDKKGFAASLELIRMFNMRRILKKEKSLGILGMFLADYKKLKKVGERAPAHIQEWVNYV